MKEMKNFWVITGQNISEIDFWTVLTSELVWFILFFCKQWGEGRRQRGKENSYILVQRLGLLAVLLCQASTSTMRKNTQKLPFKREMEASYLWFCYRFREGILKPLSGQGGRILKLP